MPATAARLGRRPLFDGAAEEVGDIPLKVTTDLITGTVAVTLANATSAASGTFTPPTITGTVAVTTANATSNASGSFTPATITGTVAVTTANATSAASGTFTPPVVAPLSDITGEIVDISDLTDSLGSIDLYSKSREWQEVISDFGSASMIFPNEIEDPPDSGLLIPNPALALITPPNTLVNLSLRGQLAVTMIFEQHEATLISQGEENEQVTRWLGRLHPAVLDRALLFPSLGVNRLPIEEDRGFNVFSPTFDDSALTPANFIMTVGDAKPGGATPWGMGLAPWDPEFPDDTAEIIWGSYIGPTLAAPGLVYGRQWITTTFNGRHKLHVAADDNAEYHTDGALTGTADGNWTKERQFDIDMSPGSHLIAWVGTNIGLYGPAGVSWALYSPGEPPTLVAHSDASATLIADYPSEVPGMTPGAALLIAINEAQARGRILYVNPTWDDVNDTNGNPWPVVADISTKVGSSVGTFIKELSGTYLDWRMPPGTFDLEVFLKGTMTTSPGVSFHSPTDPLDAMSGNLIEHHERGET